MKFILEIIRFITHRKKYWLVPILIIFLIFGGLLILTQGSALAPFVYTLF